MKKTSEGRKKGIEGLQQGGLVEEENVGWEVIEDGGHRNMKGVMT